jgi:hypothetical protein
VEAVISEAQGRCGVELKEKSVAYWGWEVIDITGKEP